MSFAQRFAEEFPVTLYFLEFRLVPAVRILSLIIACSCCLLGLWVETASTYDTVGVMSQFVYVVRVSMNKAIVNMTQPDAVVLDLFMHCFEYSGSYTCSNSSLTYNLSK